MTAVIPQTNSPVVLEMDIGEEHHDHLKKVIKGDLNKKDYDKVDSLIINAQFVEYTDIQIIKSFKLIKKIEFINEFDVDEIQNVIKMHNIVKKLLYQCKSLYELVFRNNKLKSLPADLFKYGSNLEIITFESNEFVELPEELFVQCENLERVYFRENKIKKLPEKLFVTCKQLIETNFEFNELVELSPGVFSGCTQLKKIFLNNNKIKSLPSELFRDCSSLMWICCDSNEISQLPADLFKFNPQLEKIFFINNKLKQLEETLFCIEDDKSQKTEVSIIDFSSNEIVELSPSLFRYCLGLKKVYFNNNKLKSLPESIFSHCTKLIDIWFNSNDIIELPADLFKTCNQVKYINFNNNRIKGFPATLFDKCSKLRTISFNSNEICELSPNLLKDCLQLDWVYFNNNKIKELSPILFKNCIRLKLINYKSNEITELHPDTFQTNVRLEYADFTNNKINSFPEMLFSECENLTRISFETNEITEIPPGSFNKCNRLEEINFASNNIKFIQFTVLKPLNNLKNINFQNNAYFNSNFLYSLLFSKLSHNIFEQSYKYDSLKSFYQIGDNDPESQYYLCRIEDYHLIEVNFLSFFLSYPSKNWTDLFAKDALYSKMEMFKALKFTLLDLFISVMSEIDPFKCINLKNFIDHLTGDDEKLINKEFRIFSEISIKNLCARNIHSCLEAFLTNTYSDLIIQVKKAHIKNFQTFKVNELNYFKDYEKYLISPEEILSKVDYIKCFDVAIKNKNSDMAISILIMLRYFFIKYRANSQLNKILKHFNKYLIEQAFYYIFSCESLLPVVIFILDLRKLDKLMERWYNKRTFLIYDIELFNNSVTESSENNDIGKITTRPVKQFLPLIAKNDTLLKHPSTSIILKEKWQQKSEIKYFVNLFMYIIFTVVYTLYIEYHNDKSTDDATFKMVITYLSLALVAFNLALEITQMFLYIHKAKFRIYITQFTNWFELITFPLCIVAVLAKNGDLKSAFNSVTILFVYIILVTRLDKIYLGRYVKVIGKIARESIPPVIIIIILLLGFLFAFRNKADDYGEEYTYTPITKFNTTLERGLIDIYVLLVGQLQGDNMGVDFLTWTNLPTFLIYLAFMFTMSTLAFNIFTGIAINEIQSLLDDSNVQIMKDKIEYIYENTVFNDDSFLYRKFFRLVQKIYLVGEVGPAVIKFFSKNRIMKKVIGTMFHVRKKIEEDASLKVDITNRKDVSLLYKSSSLGYSDQRFLEHFGTIESMIKQNQASIKGLEEKFKDFQKVQEKINSVLLEKMSVHSNGLKEKENRLDFEDLIKEATANRSKVDGITIKLHQLEEKVGSLNRADEILDVLNKFKEEEKLKSNQLSEQVQKLDDAFQQVLFHKRMKKNKIKSAEEIGPDEINPVGDNNQ